jgi:hypothetical protein
MVKTIDSKERGLEHPRVWLNMNPVLSAPLCGLFRDKAGIDVKSIENRLKIDFTSNRPSGRGFNNAFPFLLRLESRLP